MSRTGVLLLGFGGPDSLDAVGPFMCNLMGREPSDELVERVCRRYLAIGGASPLTAIADAIARQLAGELYEARGEGVPVAVGMRYWHPLIEEALEGLSQAGCERIVCVSLSPFESKVASEAYREAVGQAAEELGGLEIVEAPLVSDLEEFITFLAGSTAVALEQIEPNTGAVIAFTAHSLPESDLVEDDPYVAGLRRVADAVADRLALAPGDEGAGAPLLEGFRAYGNAARPRPWFLVYQSKGERPGHWLEPDLDELIDAAVAAGVPAIVACPIGFMTDHMETLYDLDIVAAGKALDLDMEFVRAPGPNDDESVVAGLARSVARLL